MLPRTYIVLGRHRTESGVRVIADARSNSVLEFQCVRRERCTQRKVILQNFSLMEAHHLVEVDPVEIGRFHERVDLIDVLELFARFDQLREQTLADAPRVSTSIVFDEHEDLQLTLVIGIEDRARQDRAVEFHLATAPRAIRCPGDVRGIVDPFERLTVESQRKCLTKERE